MAEGLDAQVGGAVAVLGAVYGGLGMEVSGGEAGGVCVVWMGAVMKAKMMRTDRMAMVMRRATARR